MSSARPTILPLFIARRTARMSILKDINGKNVFLIFLLVSILGTLVIIFNLPSTKSIVNQDVFVPVGEAGNDEHHVHRDDHQHRLPDRFNMKEFKEKEEVSENIKRRETVKDMMKFAWSNYKKFAWGVNELKPISKRGHSPGIFGSAPNLGATIVDSLDTLYIMKLVDEYNDAKDWVMNNLNLNINNEFSLFEVNIRFVGGLLSMHSLTDEKIYLDKAVEIGKALLPAFNSPTGIPYSLVNPATGAVRNYHWASGSCSILAEIGTLSLEFQYMSDKSGDKIFEEKINKIYEALEKVDKPEGLYFNYIDPSGGHWCGRSATMGGLADSFYEYLLKYWLYKDKTDDNLLRSYKSTMKAMKEKTSAKSNEGLTYFGEYNGGGLNKRMGHLACFSGGLYALSSQYINDLTKEERDEYSKMAEEITNTCHESYIRTPTHLGPESFTFDGNRDAVTSNSNDMYYILRPEVVESYFYLWRMTKNQKYRDWAWDAVQAIEKHCKTENGYSGISNVYDANPRKDDVQQSFFLAETLKYLYLIFSDDDVIPLDKFVFNTEAHPLLINKH